MGSVLGMETGISMPHFNLTGFFSSTWIYVLGFSIVGFIVIGAIAFLLFLKTYNKKIELYENLSGAGYKLVAKTRARIIRLGHGGGEILKTLVGGMYLSASGQKMSKNLYWFAKGPDGYYYNVILGDLDTKKGILDINPIDRDVRMFHLAIDRVATQTYGKQSFLEKYATAISAFLLFILVVGSLWIIIGRIGDSTQALSSTAETNKEVATLLRNILSGASNIARTNNILPNNLSGIVPAG